MRSTTIEITYTICKSRVHCKLLTMETKSAVSEDVVWSLWKHRVAIINCKLEVAILIEHKRIQ